MAITLVGTASGSAANGGDVTITLPAGLAENDVVLVIGGNGNAGTSADIETAGYSTDAPHSVSQLDGIVGYKVMGASPDTVVRCNGGGNSADGVAYVVMAFRGVHASVVDAATQVTDQGGDPNSQSITTVTDGAAVISAFISEDASGSIVNPPTGYGNLVSVAQSDANPVSAGSAYRIKSPAGAENPTIWDTSFSGSADNISWTIALKPATPGVANDGVLASTGTSSVAFVGLQDASGRLESPLLSTISFKATALSGAPLSATGAGTASFTGNSLATSGAFSISGAVTPSFVGAIAQAGALSATGTITPDFSGRSLNDVSVSMTGSGAALFVGATTKLAHVLEAIESRGTATVTIS